VLLAVGVLVLLRQALRTGVGELMLPFAVPVVVAVATVYSLAALTVVRSVSGRMHLASARSAVALLAAAALVRFAGPWMLTSGKWDAGRSHKPHGG
jgi:hypothetical protein